MPPVRALAKSLGASQKRLKPILDLVRGRRVDEALVQLNLLPSPWAKTVAKVVASAAANAENNMLMNRDNLRMIPGVISACKTSKAPVPSMAICSTRRKNFEIDVIALLRLLARACKAVVSEFCRCQRWIRLGAIPMARITSELWTADSACCSE